MKLLKVPYCSLITFLIMSKFCARRFLDDLGDVKYPRKDIIITEESYQNNHSFLSNLPIILQNYFNHLVRQALHSQHMTIWLGQILKNIHTDRTVPMLIAPSGNDEEELCIAIKNILQLNLY